MTQPGTRGPTDGSAEHNQQRLPTRIYVMFRKCVNGILYWKSSYNFCRTGGRYFPKSNGDQPSGASGSSLPLSTELCHRDPPLPHDHTRWEGSAPGCGLTRICSSMSGL